MVMEMRTNGGDKIGRGDCDEWSELLVLRDKYLWFFFKWKKYVFEVLDLFLFSLCKMQN